MFFKKYGDIVISIFFLILSAALMIAAKMLPKSKVMEIGPDFMPLVIGGVTFILAAILLFLSVKNFKMNTAELDPASIEACDYKRVLMSALLVLIYVFILRPVGFIVTTLVYLPLQMMVLAPDEKRTKKELIKVIIIDVIFTLVVYILFRYGFKIVLPEGIFSIKLG